jgi:hypothetical protein
MYLMKWAVAICDYTKILKVNLSLRRQGMFDSEFSLEKTSFITF